jgi:uncharacterized protein
MKRVEISGTFINLPVKDVAATRVFYTALGFGINEQFSGEHAICVPLGKESFLMLLGHDFFKGFTPRAIADATQATEVLTALQLPSRDAVDAMMAAVLANGGSEVREPQDLGFMYSRAFADPDGHIFEPLHMNALPPEA